MNSTRLRLALHTLTDQNSFNALHKLLCVCLVSLFAMINTAIADDGWRTLTPPHPLPEKEKSGTVHVNGVDIHYALYGTDNEEAVLLLHGGLSAAEDFGGQINALSRDYKVVALDSRGHGRSTDTDQPLSYQVMASDVIGVMDALQIQNASIVGFSDGGIIGIDLAINNPDRLNKVFAIGANYQTDGIRPTAFTDALIGAYVGHTAEQYAKISKTPDAWESFSAKVFAMWSDQPNYTDEQLRNISVPFVIAAGVYEEAIDETHTKRMAELIPNAKLLLIGNASHFAHWQQVDEVNSAIIEFLASD